MILVFKGRKLDQVGTKNRRLHRGYLAYGGKKRLRGLGDSKARWISELIRNHYDITSKVV